MSSAARVRTASAIASELAEGFKYFAMDHDAQDRRGVVLLLTDYLRQSLPSYDPKFLLRLAEAHTVEQPGKVGIRFNGIAAAVRKAAMG